MNIKTKMTTAMCVALGLGITPVMAQEHTKSLDVKGIDNATVSSTS